MSYKDLGYSYQEVDYYLPALPTAPAPRRRGIDPIHQRMLMVLGLVFLVVPLLAFIRPAEFGEAPAAAANPVGAEVEAAIAEEEQPALMIPDEPAVQGSISPVFAREVKHWEPQILGWADEFGLDPNLVAIIMQIESCGDPQAISIAGARGLFQVMPFHFAAGENSLDPDTNARRGLNYFVERIAQTNGDLGRAFAGYNGGHVAAAGNWSTWARETQRYYVWSTGIYDDIQAGLTESPTLQRWMEAGGASLCRQAANRLGLQ